MARQVDRGSEVWSTCAEATRDDELGEVGVHGGGCRFGRNGVERRGLIMRGKRACHNSRGTLCGMPRGSP